MPEYPLVFTLKEAVSGNGFLAGVTLNGRGLMVQEDGAWWMLGVRPAAIAERGDTPAGAYLAFRQGLVAALHDAASDANGFDAFRAEAERFFNENDAAEDERWEAAGAALQKNEPEAPFCDLPREKPGVRPVAIAVERLDAQQKVFTVADNVVESYALSMAA